MLLHEAAVVVVEAGAGFVELGLEVEEAGDGVQAVAEFLRQSSATMGRAEKAGAHTSLLFFFDNTVATLTNETGTAAAALATKTLPNVLAVICTMAAASRQVAITVCKNASFINCVLELCESTSADVQAAGTVTYFLFKNTCFIHP